jgi:hypothetical protein
VLLDTIEGHTRLRGYLGALVHLIDDLDARLSPAERLGLYRSIVVNGVFLTETAEALAGLWSDPGAASAVVYE